MFADSKTGAVRSFSKDAEGNVTLKMDRQTFDQLALVVVVGMGVIGQSDANSVAQLASLVARAYSTKADRLRLRDILPDEETREAVDAVLQRV